MDLRDCECFVAVAEELHFGRAASRLCLAQPPLSQRIKALEEELGARLLARTSRKVALTPAGEAFYREARALLVQAGEARDVARRVALGLAGRLRVGFVNPAMDAFLSAAVAAFRKEAPEVELVLREMATRDQLPALAGGSLDVGFLRHGGLDLAGVDVTVVSRESYWLAVPAGHALATGQGRVSLADLGDVAMILPERTQAPLLVAAIEAALAAAGGRRPVVAQEAASKFTMLSLVAAGVGVALLPASVGVWERRGVVYRALEPGLPLVELAAAVPRGRADAAASRLVGLAGRLATRRGQ